jgi:hypothetical protein
MTTNAYITLTNSNASFSKRFRVVMGSLQPVYTRQQTRRRTLTGKSDNQVGAARQGWTMTLRVHTESDPLGSSYGLLSDLTTLWLYNNPAATPSNLITFTDHLGAAHTVEFAGDFNRENLTPYLDGPDAAYLVQVVLEDVGP